jgi:glutamate racemase
MSMQYLADTSQKFTCPVVNVVVPAVTEAVSVTTVPEVTVVTGSPATVVASVIALNALVCAATEVHGTHSAAVNAVHHAKNLKWRRARALKGEGLRSKYKGRKGCKP